MGKVLTFAAAVLPAISGALHRPTWIIPTCAALAVLSFFVTAPQVFERLHRRGGGQMEFTIIGLLALGTIGCSATFVAGYLLRYFMFPP